MKRLWENLFGGKNLETEIELHIAGSTVRHKNPFENLPVPRNSEELDENFINKWVVPFYMSSFRNLSKEDEKKFIDIYPEINSEIVAKLLGDFNWRTRIVGAFFSAIKDFSEFEEIIGNHLLKSEVCYAGSGYCLALASFGTSRSVDFLKTYLDYYLTRKDLWFDQHEVFAALVWLNKNEAEKYRLLWSSFVKNKPNWNAETSFENFENSMLTLQRIKKSVI